MIVGSGVVNAASYEAKACVWHGGNERQASSRELFSRRDLEPHYRLLVASRSSSGSFGARRRSRGCVDGRRSSTSRPRAYSGSRGPERRDALRREFSEERGLRQLGFARPDLSRWRAVAAKPDASSIAADAEQIVPSPAADRGSLGSRDATRCVLPARGGTWAISPPPRGSLVADPRPSLGEPPAPLDNSRAPPVCASSPAPRSARIPPGSRKARAGRVEASDRAVCERARRIVPPVAPADGVSCSFGD